MEPNVTPLRPLATASTPAVKPSSMDFREAIISGSVVTDKSPTFYTTFTATETDFVIRIPRHVLYADVRLKREMDEATQKEKRSATLVVSATAAPHTDLILNMDEPGRKLRVSMPLKPTINISLGLVHRDARVAPIPVAAPPTEGDDADLPNLDAVPA